MLESSQSSGAQMKNLSVENNVTSLALASHNMTQQQYVQMADDAEYQVKEINQPETWNGEESSQRRNTTDRRFPKLLGNQLDIKA